MLITALLLAVQLQPPISSVRIPAAPPTTPPGFDTTGYWQQRADYRMVATLDERQQAIRATGTLTYVNQSPDTLRSLWFHQHLNAFRPGSKWSAVDAKEGRTRFQALADPDYAYERLTAAPQVNGVPVTPDYPLGLDSTVLHLPLPKPLRPRDSVQVTFEWTARVSTVPRRQGRRGRSYDFAQWFPKVAVYDRGGWRPNPLVPAGEFYGEFGTFDVTLVLPNDQVVAATGVPVSGDPGWARVSATRGAPVRTASNAYGQVPAAPAIHVPSGYRAVRFVARNVHHFAWSVSPGFRYEGGTYVRPQSPLFRQPGWDTVSVHVLYRADAEDDCYRAYMKGGADTAAERKAVRTCVETSKTQWEQGKALGYAQRALTWLEALYGDYPYPQLTVVKRIDGGGTEFPMMVENGSASLGLTLHEVGHIFTFGILANNEWQSGWLDEGFTSYQTALERGDVRVLLAARLAQANARDPAHPADTALARLRAALDTTAARQARDVQQGVAQPIGLRADLFTSFSVYNAMVYGRAQAMYQALHDVLGEEDFQATLRDYYARWQFRHVDRWALQASAERVSKRRLAWFFTQWVEDVGVIDYGLSMPIVQQEGRDWVVTVHLARKGRYRHPMPVGVRTKAGWTVVRADPLQDAQFVTVRVSDAPDAVWLDPFGSTDSPSASYFRITLPPLAR